MSGLGHTACVNLCSCACACVYLLKAHTWFLIGKDVQEAQQEHTAVSHVSFPSKVNSRRRCHNVRHAALAGPPLMVSTCTPLWPWFSLRTAPRPRHLCLLIFLCVPPAAFSVARRKVKDARGKKRFLFCSSNMQAQLDSKTNYRALGKIAQLFVCFVRLLLFCF